MASLATAEPALCPGALPAAESIVPACMFAPDRGCVDDPCGEEGSEDGEGTNGETADHLDLSSKVGLTVNSTQKRLVSKIFQPSSGLFWLSEMNDVRWLYTIPVACELDTAHFVQTVQNSRKWHVYCSACVSGQLAGYPAVHLLQEQSGSLDCQNTVTVIEWFAEQVAMKWNKNNNMICQYLCGCLNHTTSTRPVWLCLLLFDKTFTPMSLCLTSQLVLVSPTGEQYDSLLRHLRERIDEGCGETIYVVGMGSGEGDLLLCTLWLKVHLHMKIQSTSTHPPDGDGKLR